MVEVEEMVTMADLESVMVQYAMEIVTTIIVEHQVWLIATIGIILIEMSPTQM